MIPLATYNDLSAAIPEVSAQKADRLLYHASLLVLLATRGAAYATHADGTPRHVYVADALRDAAVNQAAAWHRAGVDPDRPGSTGTRQKSSVSVGGGSVSYAGTEAEAEGARASLLALVPAAEAPLALAGLLTVRVRLT